jgi:hypothetical protein
MVLSGHYHISKIIQPKNIIHVSAPSLVESPDSFRVITIKNDGTAIFKTIDTNPKSKNDNKPVVLKLK